MNSNTLIYLFGIITTVGFSILFYVEYKKESKLIPVNCKILDYDCIGRAANTTFIYNNKKYSIGGAPSELCYGKMNNKEYVTLYYYKKGDSFYLKNSTNSFSYLFFVFFGISIFFIPYIKRKINNYLMEREFKK